MVYLGRAKHFSHGKNRVTSSKGSLSLDSNIMVDKRNRY